MSGVDGPEPGVDGPEREVADGLSPGVRLNPRFGDAQPVPAAAAVPVGVAAARSRRRAWWWVVPADFVGLVVVGVVATRADMLWSNNPAYPATLALAVVLAALVWWRSFRRRPRPATAWRLIGWVAGAIALLLLAGALWWLRSAEAEPVAISAVTEPASSPAWGGQSPRSEVAVTQSRTRIEFRPVSRRPASGFVFWPGALVDPRAYAPLLRRIAEDGVLVVAVKEPFDIAFFDPNAAGSVIEANPDVGTWYVGGHSLGGVVAATYAADHRDTVAGLVLWAAYPLGDLRSQLSGSRVLSVSASNDGLTTPADVEASRANLPEDARFVVVDGAVHSYFGDYGEQLGDGTPTVPKDVAQTEIVGVTASFLIGPGGPT